MSATALIRSASVPSIGESDTRILMSLVGFSFRDRCWRHLPCPGAYCRARAIARSMLRCLLMLNGRGIGAVDGFRWEAGKAMGGKRRIRGQRNRRQATMSFAPGTPRPPTTLSGAQDQPRQWAYPVRLQSHPAPTRHGDGHLRAATQPGRARRRHPDLRACRLRPGWAAGATRLARAELLAEGEDAAAPRWREPARRIEALLESLTALRSSARGWWPSSAIRWRSTPSPSIPAAPAPATSMRSNRSLVKVSNHWWTTVDARRSHPRPPISRCSMVSSG